MSVCHPVHPSCNTLIHHPVHLSCNPSVCHPICLSCNMSIHCPICLLCNTSVRCPVHPSYEPSACMHATMNHPSANPSSSMTDHPSASSQSLPFVNGEQSHEDKKFYWALPTYKLLLSASSHVNPPKSGEDPCKNT